MSKYRFLIAALALCIGAVTGEAFSTAEARPLAAPDLALRLPPGRNFSTSSFIVLESRRRDPSRHPAPPLAGHPQQPRPAGVRRQDSCRLQRPRHRRSRRCRPAARVAFAQSVQEAARLNEKAIQFHQEGRYAEAEALDRDALAITEKALGPDHPDVALSLNNLAEVYRTQGRYAEAEPLYKRALTINERAFGPGHPAVATALNNLATL